MNGVDGIGTGGGGGNIPPGGGSPAPAPGGGDDGGDGEKVENKDETRQFSEIVDELTLASPAERVRQLIDAQFDLHMMVDRIMNDPEVLALAGMFSAPVQEEIRRRQRLESGGE